MPYCMTCKHRDAEGYCESGKLAEDAWLDDKDKSDMLIYDFHEGGGFWVGERFGCVHHTHKDEQYVDKCKQS